MPHWGYDTENGPHTWAKEFPEAGGPRQSPVDIDPGQAKFDETLANNPLVINYKTERNLSVENNGHSYKANINEESTISGGPLGSGKYRLVQFHFHWGRDDKCGSEHTYKGKMYPSELHLVHYNAEKYSSFNEAVTQPDGLAVLGVFIKVGTVDHEAFKILSDNATRVKCKSFKTDTGADFDPSTLLPDSISNYWTYEGSLTTPPCCESVQWIVLQQPISVSPEQIRAFRNLCCDENGSKRILDNFRPPLPLGARELRASFQ
ncbi:carbonic anhydrase-like isoform X2 [Physella acuta]|nr:carbonic anhydrase-like isoform X2 [Physella acuta]XP_059156659.1 carbonic anhydrase-like isoform X2 [Physella acuta]XP_059156660.1 carbonic anhydrase-like isoform X2 [Physella acuta]XP_059156661.1 carbonic anhydrase-like isoform X2 [Physella acuta]